MIFFLANKELSLFEAFWSFKFNKILKWDIYRHDAFFAFFVPSNSKFSNKNKTRNKCYDRWWDCLISLSKWYSIFHILEWYREIFVRHCMMIARWFEYVTLNVCYSSHWYFIEEYFGCDAPLFWKYLWQSAFQMTLDSIWTEMKRAGVCALVSECVKERGVEGGSARWGHNRQIALCNMDFVLWF